MTYTSRLGAFCSKFIEAGWLAAIILAPLFFNIYSSRVFEPDKIALVRSLSLVMIVTWLVLRAETLRVRSPRQNEKSGVPTGFLPRLRKKLVDWASAASQSNPLTLPVLFLIGVYLVSTLASVQPTVSILGSYQRMQGLYTLLSYIVIFFLAASLVRSQAQIERAISVALIVSFPIAFYGIIQHYFLDPLPWAGDVTTRVASNLGNSIFVGAFLIMTVPLALGRLIAHSRSVAREFTETPRRRLTFAAAGLTVFVLMAIWGLSFELGAKQLIEGNYSGVLTSDQLSASTNNFMLALGISAIVLIGWLAAGLATKKQVSGFLLVGVYALILGLEIDTLLFSQSRGPLLGFLGGLFAFGVIYALVRGARKLAVAAVGTAVVLLVFLTALNLDGSPLAALRELPYVGRLGRVFETEGGTGKVRVLIWEGALNLITPHPPLWSPTTGDDPFNLLRPLIGYGPETMYVAYNQYYPAELGQLESRNASPDRSHNETFDALIITGILGLVAEQVLFLALFYFALKWLGFISSARERNTFIAFWFGGAILLTLVFGLALGWQFLGVALPAGMILGFFAYLVLFTLKRGTPAGHDESPTRALLLIMLLSVFVSHFIEIHFGIAIVSTRLYFWFFAALMVAIGTSKIPELQVDPLPVRSQELPAPIPPTPLAGPEKASSPGSSATRRKRRRASSVTPSLSNTRNSEASMPRDSGARIISTAPLICMAFLVGLILATMGFDYINTNQLTASSGSQVTALDVIGSALTVKNTTSGAESSLAMFWLFLITLSIALAIGVAEWGRDARLILREWLIAAGLFAVLALAIFSSFLFYHVILVSTTGTQVIQALNAALNLFILFTLLVMSVAAASLLFDTPLPTVWIARLTNIVLAPVLALVAAVLVFSTNVSTIQADVLYKQASALSSGTNLPVGIQLFKQVLELQPNEDYYLLFLGRAYLEAAKTTNNPTERLDDLNNAEEVLTRAQKLNPLNTDHTANLARLEQARASLETNPDAQLGHYRKSVDYYSQATRLSPNTVHLYDQHAQALIDFSDFLKAQKDAAGAAQALDDARAILDQAFRIDSTFCLTYGVRALTQTTWRAQAQDALTALKTAPNCGDVFEADGRALGLQGLAAAGDQAVAQGESAAFEQMALSAEQSSPGVELYTVLANFYSKAGRIQESQDAIDSALELIPTSDSDTRKRYEDFRATLVSLQQAIQAANANPNDPAAHRSLANAWLARGQASYALPEFKKVVSLLPNDYDAQRSVTLLLIQQNQLDDAAREISRTLTLAPESDRQTWMQIQTILQLASAGNKADALAQLSGLTKTISSDDTVMQGALRALDSALKS